ncbi:glycine zipper 2TM domain-containing protein [Comamonas testosteroni]|uniref:glycine zipper 2TM domain-containing protein n=1 Tax=Comamonas testosteroni TaxID=285 RepID=UPI00265FF384|nr:glycine zipper 2TM domain-containing protein [Comamonas testosteroni]WKL17092.1 glycine zipper 2TM domain-containing protein [Comamonas testosteroni]
MQINQRWGRLAMVSAIVAALSACAAYPQGGYQSGGYQNSGYQGGYSQGAYSGSGYPGSTQAYPVGNNQAQTYPANNCGYNNPNCYSQQPQQYAQQGRVMNIETVRVQDGSGIGAGGAIAGGVIGGVLGNQVGKGSGRTLATIAGVVGGALAGNAVQNSVGGGSVRDIYRVTVQLQDGSVRALDYQQPPQLSIGEYVRVEGNQIFRR